MEKKENLHAGHRRRKKEQFLKYGLDAFAPHEALELLLYYAIPRVDTNAMAHALLNRFGTLAAVLEADAGELMRAFLAHVAGKTFDAEGNLTGYIWTDGSVHEVPEETGK